MHLEKLLIGKDASRFLLIEDTLDQSGYNLLKAFMKCLLNKNCDLNLLCLEWSPDVIMKEFASTISNLKIYDGISDPLGWDSSSNCRGNGYNIHNVLKNVPAIKDSILVLDSLTVFLLHNPASSVYKALYRLLSHPFNAVKQVIAIAHKDVHDDETLKHMESLASSVMQVSSSNSSSLSLCSLLHMTSGGKVIQEVVQWKVNEFYELKEESFYEDISFKDPVIEYSNPMDHLTFNLNLKADEKAAKEQLILPFTQNAANEGNIYYQMDDVDDFDEDDPDDDLII